MTKDVQDLMNAVEKVRDAFHAAVWTGDDPDAVLALAADGCTLATVPAGTGATGTDALRRHLIDEVIGHRPADLAFRRLSRTGDRWQVADETMASFTHDRELPWLLPGVAATHRAVEVLVITVVAVRRGRVTGYRALWDQLGLLEQLGVAPVPREGALRSL